MKKKNSEFSLYSTKERRIIINTLLSKIQQLNSIFDKSLTAFTHLAELCDQICNIIGCNIYVFDLEGNINAYSIAAKFECPYTERSLQDKKLPSYYFNLFNTMEKPLTGQYEKIPVCTYANVKICEFDDRYFSLYPVYLNCKKIAGLLLIRYGTNFSQTDNILCEYASAIIYLDLFQQKQLEIQQKSLEQAAVKLAVGSLSFSELRSVSAILEQLDGLEGCIFLNKIAEQCFSTHSTVSGALKKLEAAGVISTKSQGVKGKYVKITNQKLYEEVYITEKQYRKKKQKNSKR